jgi:hypothetical protein
MLSVKVDSFEVEQWELDKFFSRLLGLEQANQL